MQESKHGKPHAVYMNNHSNLLPERKLFCTDEQSEDKHAVAMFRMDGDRGAGDVGDGTATHPIVKLSRPCVAAAKSSGLRTGTKKQANSSPSITQSLASHGRRQRVPQCDGTDQIECTSPHISMARTKSSPHTRTVLTG